ncbi:hypothetical protein ACOMHN_053004 [Nucella lapillus]
MMTAVLSDREMRRAVLSGREMRRAVLSGREMRSGREMSGREMRRAGLSGGWHGRPHYSLAPGQGEYRPGSISCRPSGDLVWPHALHQPFVDNHPSSFSQAVF